MIPRSLFAIHWIDRKRGGEGMLWDSINVKRAPWASNPWVWAVEFRRLP